MRSRENSKLVYFRNLEHQNLFGSISSFSRGKDSRGTKGGHWTERSEGSGWSDSGTPDSLFFAKQKATLKIKKFKTRHLSYLSSRSFSIYSTTSKTRASQCVFFGFPVFAFSASKSLQSIKPL